MPHGVFFDGVFTYPALYPALHAVYNGLSRATLNNKKAPKLVAKGLFGLPWTVVN